MEYYTNREYSVYFPTLNTIFCVMFGLGITKHFGFSFALIDNLLTIPADLPSRKSNLCQRVIYLFVWNGESG